MSDPLADLHREMETAAAALDFETARRLRDRIALLRGGAEHSDVDTDGLLRQQPGAMGLGTSRQRVTPPPGWVRPTKPDPLTKGRKR
ncbi:MAG TPA: UvrB/UvrC motif-containing protein [Sphingomonas sp.]|nr:UvrB/UvrC motif-containing protein [Sphingomonas sp.]